MLGEDGRVQLQEGPAPGPCGPNDVLLAPLRLGICGSDVHVLRRAHPFVSPPVVTGHECAARVVATGAEVTACAAGDMVVVNPLLTCGGCDRCRSGRANLCPSAKVLGFAVPGAARDRFVLEQRYCHRVPDGVPAARAVLAEPLAVGWHAAGRVTGGLGRVLVIGGGPVGLAVLAAARARGARHITLAEPVAAKRALAERGGADRVLDTAGAAGAAVADTVFDCVAAPATLAAAGSAAVPGGTVVVVGVPSGDRPLPLARLQRWEIDVLGTGLYLGADIDAVIARIAADPAVGDGLVTAEHPVERAADAFAATDEPEQVKVLISWPEPAGD
ncbi:alcohol dehydrogenase catalytic domain-containing protein [Streptomyces sp. NPDC048845]|uniref:zinc-dependent alcohol dehydrogenase n=1 Tax=Streptomyces sp. NPDC048845 TaxID=3155390 RepID=UPI00341E91E0